MDQGRELQRVRVETPDVRRRQLYRRAILVTIGGNALLVAAKGILAWLTGSSAVFSDAANSLSDTIYGLMMGGGLYIAQRPADETHPQGHGRFEPMVSLLIAAAMALTGAVAFWQSLRRMLTGGEAITLVGPTIVLLGSMAVKGIMYFEVRRAGEKVDSPAILASAQDNLADILTTAAALGGVWGSRMIHPVLDPVAGLLVALWIFRTTGKIFWENLGYLTGRGAPAGFHDRVAREAAGVPGVENVHQVIAEYVGPRLRVDIHINVDGQTSLEQAHAIAENVQAAVNRISKVDLVYVYTEPTGTE